MSDSTNTVARQYSDFQQISFEGNLVVTPEVRTVQVKGEDRAVVDIKVITNVVRGNQSIKSVRVVTFWGAQANAVSKSGLGKGDKVRIDATDAYENANTSEAGKTYNEIRLTGLKFSILFRKDNSTSTSTPVEAAPEANTTGVETEDIPF